MTAVVPRRALPWPAGRPWSSYAALHERGSPAWFDDDLDAWIVIGHAAASEVLRGSGWSSDPSLGSSFAALASSMGLDATAFGQLFIFADPPEHTRLRRAVQPPFGASPVEALRRRLRSVAESALAGIGPGDEVDLVDRVVRPVPLAVIGELFDLPIDVVGVLAQESPALVRVLDVDATSHDLAAAAGALTALILELLPLASERRSHPGRDVLSWIAADETLALEEVVFATLLLAVAGHETTTNLVGTVVADRLGRTHLGDGWATEAARLCAPVQAVVRVATVEQLIGGIEVAPGDQVVVAIAAANRDPAVFDDPDAFVAGRRSDPLSFGLGRHHCLGSRLALVELEEIVSAIAAHGPVEFGPATWTTSRTICGPTTLPARFHPPA